MAEKFAFADGFTLHGEDVINAANLKNLRSEFLNI
jgi:hypothetical protein